MLKKEQLNKKNINNRNENEKQLLITDATKKELINGFYTVNNINPE